MKNLNFLIILLIIAFDNLNSQNKLFYELKSTEKNHKYASFDILSNNDYLLPFYEKNKDSGAPLIFKVDLNNTDLIRNQKPELLRISLPRDDKGHQFNLLLFRKDPFRKNAIAKTDKGALIQLSGNVYYRGIIENDSSSLVAISLTKYGISGVISSSKFGQFDFGLTNDLKNHVIYKSEKLPFKNYFNCDYVNKFVGGEKIDINNNSRDEGDCVAVYLETAHNIYLQKGNQEEVLNYVNGFFNVVSAVFQNEGISVLISEIFIWTSDDPYPNHNSNHALDYFRSYRPDFNGNVAQLLDITANNNGGRGYLDVLCNDIYNYSYSDIYPNYNNFPNYSWTVNVVTHELGHNFGSEHTHSCSWPNGAIDDCYAVEGTCNPGPHPDNGGTIMSYCHLNGTGIILSNGFGEYPGDFIRSRVAANSCLNYCDVPCPTFVISEQAVYPSCYGFNNGSLSVSEPTVGAPPFSYLWSNGSTSNSISNLYAGTYSITITDALGCTGNSTFIISEPPAISVDDIIIQPKCFGGNDASITLTNNGGSTMLKFNWSNGSTASSIFNLYSGNYTVTISDENNCIYEQAFFVSQPTPIFITETIKGISCHNYEDGNILINATGGTSPLNYLWNNGNPTNQLIDLSAGNYIVTVTDFNSCSKLKSYTLTDPPPINVNIITTKASSGIAADGSAVVVVEGGQMPYIYNWSNGEDSSSVGNLIPGIYSLTVTDNNGCNQVNIFSITSEDCDLSVEFLVQNITCHGLNNGQVNCIVSGSHGEVFYNWSHGNNKPVIDSLSAGEYTITITDDSCTVVEVVYILEPGEMVLLPEIVMPTCGEFDGSISFDNLENYTFLWSDGSNDSQLTNLSYGTYSVTVTDNLSCNYEGEFDLSYIDSIAPTIFNNIDTLYLDETGNATFKNQANYFFEDNCDLGLMEISKTEFNCEDLGENEIHITIYDKAQNSATYSLIVNVVDTITPFPICPENITKGLCQGPVFWDLQVFTDNCSIDGFQQTQGLTPGSIFPLGTTVNSYLLIDKSGNISTCSFQILIKEGLYVSSDKEDVLCNGESNGIIDLDTSNLKEPVSIQWSNGATESHIENLKAGIYYVTVHDGNNCIYKDSFKIEEPALLEIEIVNVENATTEDSPDGSIVINIKGGQGSYIFQWYKDGELISTEKDLSEALPGSYQLIVSDSNGCVERFEGIIIGTDLYYNSWSLSNILVYPNPVDDQLIISSKDLKGAKCELFDVFGRKLSNFTANNEKEILYVTYLSIGSYYLRINKMTDWFLTRIVIIHN